MAHLLNPTFKVQWKREGELQEPEDGRSAVQCCSSGHEKDGHGLTAAWCPNKNSTEAWTRRGSQAPVFTEEALAYSCPWLLGEGICGPLIGCLLANE